MIKVDMSKFDLMKAKGRQKPLYWRLLRRQHSSWKVRLRRMHHGLIERVMLDKVFTARQIGSEMI